MKREPVITPIVHRNGDTRETLLRQVKEAYRAVSKAITAVEQCAGNGRNFYPEPGRLQRYQEQHHERLQQLKGVRESLEAEAIQIQDEAE